MNIEDKILKLLESKTEQCKGTSDVIYYDRLESLSKELASLLNDKEKLISFADWLQYNGKWSLPEQQVKDFLKEY